MFVRRSRCSLASVNILMTSWRSPSAYQLPRDYRHQPETPRARHVNDPLNSKCARVLYTSQHTVLRLSYRKDRSRLRSPPFSPRLPIATQSPAYRRVISQPAEGCSTQRLCSSPLTPSPLTEVTKQRMSCPTNPCKLNDPKARLPREESGALLVRRWFNAAFNICSSV